MLVPSPVGCDTQSQLLVGEGGPGVGSCEAFDSCGTISGMPVGWADFPPPLQQELLWRSAGLGRGCSLGVMGQQLIWGVA